MPILEEVSYSKPPETDAMYANTSIQEVDGIPVSEYKAVSPSETVVPRTTISGGIKGSDKVYPPVTYRKFSGSTKQEERVIQDAKKIGVEEPPAEPAPAPEIEEVKQMIKQAKSNQTPEGAAPGDMPAAMAAMMESFLVQITKHNLQPAEKEQPAEKPAPLTTVKFKGAFGQIDAPYKQVIKGERCIALVPPEEGAVQYEPPVSTEAVLEITVNGVIHRVVNAGITFSIPGIGRVVVLLLAPDLQPGE